MIQNEVINLFRTLILHLKSNNNFKLKSMKKLKLIKLKSMKKFTFIIICMAISNFALAQINEANVTKVWMEKVTNSDFYASTYGITSDENNNVYNAIYSNGTLLKAYDESGLEIYSKDINEVSFPSAIKADKTSKYVYICGGPNFTLCQLEKSTGDVVWTKTLTPNGSWGSFYAMEIDSDGNIIAVGADGGYRIFKFNTSGELIWDNTFMLQVGDFPLPRAVACNGNDIVVTGECGSGSNAALALLYITSNGELKWETYDTSKSGAQGVLVSSDNNIVLTGPSSVNSKQFLHKYDLDGNNIWKKDGSEFYSGFAIAEDAAGNFIVAGCITTDLSTWEGEQSITCYSNEGEILWNHLEQDDFSHYAMALSLSENGNIVVSGVISNTEYQQWAYSAVYKYDITSDISLLNNDNCSIIVYPNPSNGLLKIQFKDKPIHRAVIYNIINTQGVLVKEGQINVLSSEIDISNLNNGTYLVTIKDDKNLIFSELFVLNK